MPAVTVGMTFGSSSGARTWRSAVFRKNALLAVAAALVAGGAWTTLVAFDPQPDPPAFGVISITPDQTIRLNAVCSAHGVKGEPAAPCLVELMFHDAAGNVLVSQAVRLRPGQAASLDYSTVRTAGFDRVGIVPCIQPDPARGRVLPTAEVFDSVTGQTAFVVNPVTPRLSFVAGQLAN